MTTKTSTTVDSSLYCRNAVARAGWPETEDRRAKAAAKAAFVAYEAAMRDGDTELAEAARRRFLRASAALAGRSR